METFLINLARRRDRLEAMAAQLKGLGLSYQKVPALDASTVSEAWLSQYFETKGPLGELPKGDKCCSLSHRRAWCAFLSSGTSYGVILEDDVELDAAAGPLLKLTEWIPPSVQLLKLEHFGPPAQRVLLSRKIEVDPGRRIAEIRSRHTGAGAYIISREAARVLLAAQAKWSVSVDHLMFNPNVSPFMGLLHPYQLLPVIARQTASVGGPSDIAHYRDELRRPNLSLLWRELSRAYYELRLLPRQVGEVLSGRATLTSVRNDNFVRVKTDRSLQAEDAMPSQRPAQHSAV